MRKVSVTLNEGLKTKEILSAEYIEEGFCIDFFIDREELPQKELLLLIKQKTTEYKWINFKSNNVFINLDNLKKSFPSLFKNCEWMKGSFLVKPEYDVARDSNIPVVTFEMSKEEIQMKSPKKIFLSHKGSNKEYVRQYYDVLKEFGFEPWLDDEDMPAGTSLDRGILEGFQQSCACVFFITPEFEDEFYLKTEVDYAIYEQRLKGDKFAIITLQFEDENGELGDIPDLLKRFVWKTPENNLSAIKHILKALPIESSYIDWK